MPHLPLAYQSAGEVEIDILRKLHHEYIVKLYTAFQDELYYYLVLEYLPGCNVYEWLHQHGHYTEQQTRQIMFRILTALTVLESQGIVHRDLKLENLVVENPYDPTSVKLIDFGLGAFLWTPRIEMKCGSPGFVAPEIISKKPYGTPVDIFSAGVVLFCILTGTSPFYSHGDTPSMILYKNQDCKVNYAPNIWKNISLEARDLLSKLLHRDPEKRYSASQALMHCWMTRCSRSLPTKNLRFDFLTESHPNDHEIISTVNPVECHVNSLAFFYWREHQSNTLNFHGPNQPSVKRPRGCLLNETSVTRVPLLRSANGQFAVNSIQNDTPSFTAQTLTQFMAPSLETISLLSMLF